MFDFGFSELLLIGAVALVVLGPERLPKAARMAGSLFGRVQRMVGSVKQELSAQVEMEELRKAKQEFETAAESFRTEVGSVGESAQNSLNAISSGLKPWERVPEQHTPADFGADEYGRPAGADSTETGQTAAWKSYLMPSEKKPPTGGFQTASLHKQAMRRKRDMRPRHRPKPQLRVRKK
ncbi:MULTISPECIES: Sec-independent protein translocase protein TatB [unclassified Neisseria]|uniref:Sec-independent protein translocase protein TatB n=1 Tax=unclassified Neisseria TaxID=2623750 RepID=UPI0010718067|nr:MULTISPECIES: Sec-independent protein translocase protein TatB [unclassified Neisseria]MBF0804127.1 twin-arginine translocase subunit TatB [Neisseria sp. 19428wB4_WF04]TFU43144.1 twin-arginine translocase subunit TatB [Neisseria sp. WF04]